MSIVPNNAAPDLTTYVCDFCRKTQRDVKRLIAGPSNHHICNECVDLGAAINRVEGVDSEFDRESRILAKARTIATQWRAQEGIAASHLDELAAVVLDA